MNGNENKQIKLGIKRNQTNYEGKCFKLPLKYWVTNKI